MADQLGLDMYVLAFEGGFRIYKSLGFELLEHLELDDSIYGGAGVFHRYFLERKAKTRVDGDVGPKLPAGDGGQQSDLVVRLWEATCETECGQDALVGFLFSLAKAFRVRIWVCSGPAMCWKLF